MRESSSTTRFNAMLIAVLAIAWFGICAESRGEQADTLPPELQGVGVDEHLDGALPLDARFVDDAGRPVRLGDYFDGRRPVVLQLGYYGCPTLCGLVTNGMFESLNTLTLKAGQDYRVVFVSINPQETATLASRKKQNYLREFGKEGSADGWHFLVGTEDNIQALAQAVGFNFRWDERSRQFAHPAVIAICTPDARLSRYLYGVKIEPQTLRLSLVEASQGKIGTTGDKLLLFCFHYEGGRYQLAAQRLMAVGGAITVLVLGLVLLRYFIKEARARRAGSAGGSSSTQ